jgi:hypothetical protein
MAYFHERESEHQKTLWRLVNLNPELFTPKEIETFLSSFHMPYKGNGGIEVLEQDVERAKELLKEFVGEDEYGYAPENFICSGHAPFDYYGKFEIEDFHKLLKLFVEKDIVIVQVSFEQ